MEERVASMQYSVVIMIALLLEAVPVPISLTPVSPLCISPLDLEAVRVAIDKRYTVCCCRVKSGSCWSSLIVITRDEVGDYPQGCHVLCDEMDGLGSKGLGHEEKVQQ